MFIVMKFNFLKIRGLAVPLMVLAIICLVLVVTPLGIDVK